MLTLTARNPIRTLLTIILVLAPAFAAPVFATSNQAELTALGQKLFFQETFAGNGRTCGTCHPAENNFTIDPTYIARLPSRHPLFVAEFTPALKKGFENPRLMREFGLIMENLDGFDDLQNRFVMRSVPHMLALKTSVASPDGPRTGWSGDGAPGDGSLRAFTTGAVIQHFTKTLGRVPGVDFRLPTDTELDAIEAFMLSLGRQDDLRLPLPLNGTLARHGQDIFLDNNKSKCNICHQNAGAVTALNGVSLGNASFDTGVAALPDIPARLSGEKMPFDDGFGTPGNGLFNTPPLVEAADTAPYFHNNAALTLESAVAFYNTPAFNESPAGRMLASLDPQGAGINLDAGQVQAIGGFLRVINALDNMSQSQALLAQGRTAGAASQFGAPASFNQAAKELEDAIRVLSEANLHPQAVTNLRTARLWSQWAGFLFFLADPLSRLALADLERARGELIATQPAPQQLAVRSQP
jgi:cytochrome c553